MNDNRRPTFCALNNISNEHIVKDHGLLSWGLSNYHGYDSFLATYENGDYPNMQYIPGVGMEFILRKTGKFLLDSLLWLWRNSKRIDVLFIYHPVMSSVLQAMVYKFRNPSGKIYLKFDGWYPSKHRGSLWKRPFYRWLVNKADCVSTELEENAPILSSDWGRKIVCVANPINPNELQAFRPFSERSNTILTVSRLGTRQKATEILLEAFAKIGQQVPEWKLVLAGYFSENVNVADEFYAAHPELKERVIFTGEIRDRNTLTGMYRDAKIFAFPSRWESFGIVLTEAMLQGCFPVTTNIETSRRITANFRFALGSEVDDVDGLAENLLYACTHPQEIEAMAIDGRNEALRRCDLRKACNTIAEELK